MSGIIPADAVAIGLGAFAGAMARYQAGRLAAEYIASDPKRFGHLTGWHTAAINVSGSFVLGGVTGAPLVHSKRNPAANLVGSGKHSYNHYFGLTPRAKLMFGVGFCGSFTTFSTYSVDVVNWISQGKMGKAAAYVMTNNVGGILAAAAGLVVVKKLFGV
ncbi:hypothetical protein ACA910_017148 [Epithemia clementina (nom. ined.)]